MVAAQVGRLHFRPRSASIRSETIMLKSLLCKLNIRHDRHVEHAEDGALYKRCRRCGKDDDSGGGGTGNPGAWAFPS